MSLVKLYLNNNIYEYIKMGTFVIYDNKLYSIDLGYYNYYMTYIHNNYPYSLKVNSYKFSNKVILNNEIFQKSYEDIINPRITLNININNPSELNSSLNIIVKDNDIVKETYNIIIDNVIPKTYNYNIISYNYYNTLNISLDTAIKGSVQILVVGDSI
jgi:hypothetical protein